MFAKNTKAKLNETQVKDIQRIFNAKQANKSQLAKLYGVSTDTINRALFDTTYGQNAPGFRFKPKLTPSQVNAIRSCWMLGGNLKELSERYKVSTSTIAQVVRNRIWHDPNYVPPSREERMEQTAKRTIVKTIHQPIKRLVIPVVVDNNGVIDPQATKRCYEGMIQTLKANGFFNSPNA